MYCLRQSLSSLKSLNISNFVHHKNVEVLRLHHSVAQIIKKPEIGSKINLKGWVKALRKMKGNNFIEISDGSTFHQLQVVIPKDHSPTNLSCGCAVDVEGTLTQFENGQLEIAADSVNVVGPCVIADGYPFRPKKIYDSDYVRQYLHFRNRTKSFGSLLRIRSDVTKHIHDYFHDNNYVNIHTPILTSNDCEGAGEVFTVVPNCEKLVKEMASKEITNEKEVFFNQKTYLSVSGQLHLEAMARSLSRVYSFNPIFRAENSKSRLHLSEFYMIEAEISFLNNIHDLLKSIEHFIKTIIKNYLDKNEKELRSYRKLIKIDNIDDLVHIHDNPFITMSYNAAITILKRNNFNIEENNGLNKQHELFLIKYTNNIPIFIINWPSIIKPFYMKQTNQDPSQVSAVDLIFPIVGELCGGSLREDNYSTLESNLTKHDLLSKLDWYLELRKYGNVPTGGFGLGFERFLQVLTGNGNIKDVIPYPRHPHNCKM